MPHAGMKKSVTIGAEQKEEVSNLPSLKASLIAPVVTIMLLALRPVAGINIDPLIALPVGGLCGAVCMRQWKTFFRVWSMGCRKCRVSLYCWLEQVLLLVS